MKKHILLIVTVLFSSTYCADQSADSSKATQQEIKDKIQGVMILNALIQRIEDNRWIDPEKATDFIQRIKRIKEKIKGRTN